MTSNRVEVMSFHVPLQPTPTTNILHLLLQLDVRQFFWGFKKERGVGVMLEGSQARKVVGKRSEGATSQALSPFPWLLGDTLWTLSLRTDGNCSVVGKTLTQRT